MLINLLFKQADARGFFGAPPCSHRVDGGTNAGADCAFMEVLHSHEANKILPGSDHEIEALDLLGFEIPHPLAQVGHGEILEDFCDRIADFFHDTADAAL